jgi:3'-phosphoadenosine 5'-phosphosulfate sulfotransferase (PAPS reductase)/FAD synthetase
MGAQVKHVVSVSGGKDSAATLLLALDRCGAGDVVPIFCDTGNEHAFVHDYLDYLESALGVQIIRLKADFSERIAAKRLFIARDARRGRDSAGRRLRWSNKRKRQALAALHPSGNPFLDLCMWKGRFPSRKAQFCTEELKRNVAVEFQMGLLDRGFSVVSWQGVRRDESQARKHAKKIERVGRGLWIFRPIVEWSAEDVFEFCAGRINNNPLYTQGMRRVGCMFCINAGKNEIREVEKRFPEHPARLAQWENIVSRCVSARLKLTTCAR